MELISKEWWIAIVVVVLAVTGIGNSLLKEFGISGLRLGPPPLSLAIDEIYCSDAMDFNKQGVFMCTFWYTVSNQSKNPISVEDTCFITYGGSNFTDGQIKKHLLNPGDSANGFCLFDGIPKNTEIEKISLRDNRQVVDAESSINDSPMNFPAAPTDW